MSQRVAQVESLLQRHVATILQRGLGDPRVRGLISVTRVEATPDLKNARVYVTILPQEHEKLTLQGLAASTKHVQSQLRPKLAMKTMPHIKFYLDESLKKQQEVFSEIAKGMQRTGCDPVDEQNDDISDHDGSETSQA